MENKQTAVKWLVEQIKNDSNLRLRGFDIDGMGKQAKAMEKAEKAKEYLRGYQDGKKYVKITYNL